MGTTTAPASPAIRQPSAKAWTYTLLTLIPSAAATRRFCEVARSITPKRVLKINAHSINAASKPKMMTTTL